MDLSQNSRFVTSEVKIIKRLYCLLTILFGSTVALQADSPNIILILTDDQGWSQRSGLMDPENPKSGSGYLHTPAMDRIADEGMRFTGGYSPAPLCTPTRRSILCGTSAARSGSEFLSKWVPADHLTLPRALKQANPEYRCAHFGKWGERMISSPEECGYDVSDGHTCERRSESAAPGRRCAPSGWGCGAFIGYFPAFLRRFFES